MRSAAAPVSNRGPMAARHAMPARVCQRHIGVRLIAANSWLDVMARALQPSRSVRLGLMAGTTIALAMLATPSFAADADTALRLRWAAPSGCPSTESVRDATLRAAALRQAPGDVLEADAHVEPSSDGSRWRVRLVTHRGGNTGERELEATTCSGIAEATAVILALALVQPDSPTPEPPPQEDAPSKLAPEPAPRRLTAAPPAFALGASLAADSTSLPAAALGGSLTIAWTPGRVRLEVDGRRWAAQSGTDGTGAGARFTLSSLGGRGCYAALRAGGFDLGPCAGADAQLVSANGFGADTNFARSAAWASIAAGALARLAVTSWLGVRARAEGAMPLSRPTFIVENRGTVHRAAPIGLAGSIGLEANFL